MPMPSPKAPPRGAAVAKDPSSAVTSNSDQSKVTSSTDVPFTPSPKITSGRDLLLSSCVQKVSQAEDLLASIRGNLAALRGLAATDGQGTLSELPAGRSSFEAPIPKAAEVPSYPAPAESPTLQAEAQPSRNGKSLKTWTHFDEIAVKSRILVDQVVVDALEQAESRSLSPTRTDRTSTDKSSNKSMASRTRTLSKSMSSLAEEELQLERHSKKLFMFSSKDVIMQRVCGDFAVPILHPEARGRLVWLTIGFFLVVYEAIAIPLHLAFDVEAAGFYYAFVQVVSCYWLTDIVLTFFTGYVTDEGSLVTSPRGIALRYLRTWFILDVVAGFPWDWISTTESMKLARGLRFMRAMKLLRLARLLRVLKLKQLMEKFESMIEANQVAVFLVGITRVVFMLYGMTHWAACIWYVIGTQTYEDGTNTSESWILHTPVPGYSRGDPLSKGEMYVYSIYFALTTMTTVGYGDITPTNFQEVCFTLGLLACASIVFAGLMGVLMDLISQLQSAGHVKQERKTALIRYLRWRAVPRKLTYCIRQHMNFLWDTNEGYDAYEDEVKAQLPPVLKTELCYHVYGGVLKAAPFLAWVKDYQPCVKHIAELVRTIILVEGDNVFRMGDPNVQLFVLISGRVFLSRNEIIAFGEEEDNFSQFAIPRHHNKTMKLSDVGKKIMGRFYKPKKEAQMNMMSRLAGRLAADAATNTKLKRLEERSTASSENSGNIFNSEVLNNASVELMKQDIEKRKAALLVQRAWRRRRAEKVHTSSSTESMSPSRSHSGGRRSVGRMRSKIMEAPSYFGESCLWVPLEEWRDATPLPYLYTATAESRSELLDLPRSAIEATIHHFSPWLGERFETFREGVVRGLRETMKSRAAGNGNGPGQSPYVDWAALDLELPSQDDAAINMTMRRALSRDSTPVRPQSTAAAALMRSRSGSGDLSGRPRRAASSRCL